MAANPADLSAALVLTPVPAADWLVVLPPAWCLLVGAVLLMLRKSLHLQALIAIPALAVLVVIDALLLAHVAANGPVTMVMGRWLPPFGIAFTADLTGVLFALAGAVVAFAGSVHALADIDASGRRYGFYPFLLLLMAGVSGAFLTGDIFNLYVWFEVLLISSFGLITLGSEPRQIDGAIKYAFLNLVATTLFLVTTGYLYGIFGTLNMADIAVKAAAGRAELPLMTLATLYFLAFGMKAAAFPVNFWLPASYHTPRVVVSALFAGLLTKVGIYALLRTLVMLFPVEREELSFLIAIVGVATMLLGALGALGQSDIRRLLGYVVISGIGVILAGLSLGSPGGIGGAIFYALHSMVVMTALYMAAGLAGRLAGSFDLNRLGGLYSRSALFSALSLVLFFAASGLPPFSGFWPKVMVAKAAIDIGAWWLTASVFLAGFLTTIALGRVFALAYWRAEVRGLPAQSIPASALLPLAGLTALTVVFGLFPDALLSLVQHAEQSLANPDAYIGSVFPGGK
ncbi:Na+/H+ antiporter subunit D [Shinella curvata]|uniref:Na+/H+ antiporter subunit D n=1 Tax=Shinella curvata TaxID=1817964 RepID=A0ABT8XFZ3_9HYPH|nr:Na+/H+ antiporter subunit D [Shinella curvata]MCJ8053323.1 Na+/H+ antiporter subunit D [Shinella curvata]MDO6122654.1 Na+/H+ antiporter subunit D [Shinella curvata]